MRKVNEKLHTVTYYYLLFPADAAATEGGKGEWG